MIAPLTHFAIEGVVWYQGETYSGLATEYRILFPALVRDWRRQWGQGDFPFLFVQLPNWDGSYLWAYTREGQAAALALPNTAMAVAIDAGAGRDVHVPNKQVVSHRLALAALKLVYGKKLVASGPIYDSMHVEGDRIRITFREVGSGLTFGDLLGKQPGLPPRPPSDRLKGFVIAGADNEGFPAKATIDGATVLVSSDRVPQPVAVRYAFEDNPDCNLYNQEGLPAAPFRTDDLPKARPADARPPTPVPAPVSPATAAVVSVHMAWNHDTTVPNGTLAGAPDPGRRVWNNLFAPGGNSLTEPTTRADNLLDSNGAATGINLALTGRNQAYRSETPDPNPVLLSYPGAGKYTAVLTGLDDSGGTLYDLYVYNHWYWGSGGVCVATTSIVEGIVPGDSENENIWDPGSLKYARLLREGVNYVVFRDVTPAAAGRIAVEADSSGGSLNSLQLVAHPKPR
jgi:hypothetical protein